MAGLDVVHSSTSVGTCVNTGRKATTIDYFLVSASLAALVTECRADTGPRGRPAPHRPVGLTFAPNLEEAKVLAVRLPPPLPPTSGRRPDPEASAPEVDWAAALRTTRAAVRTATTGNADECRRGLYQNPQDP